MGTNINHTKVLSLTNGIHMSQWSIEHCSVDPGTKKGLELHDGIFS